MVDQTGPSGQVLAGGSVGPAYAERGIAAGKKIERKKEREGGKEGRMKIP